MALIGHHGRPWHDLSDWVDPQAVAALDEEIHLGLLRVEPRYTGGSHRSLGIVPPNTPDPALPDYGEVIAGLSEPQLRIFLSLGDTLLTPEQAHGTHFGEEGDVPLTVAQQRWLATRHGVYFPWKVYVELMPHGARWLDAQDPSGKRFTRDALLHFPRVCALVQRLPIDIGSVKLLGLLDGDHGTIHRDGVPGEDPASEFITLCPRPGKGLFLYDADSGERHEVDAPAYWFNDTDWHGVEARPGFRYSVRVDGRFHPELRRALEAA